VVGFEEPSLINRCFEDLAERVDVCALKHVKGLDLDIQSESVNATKVFWISGWNTSSDCITSKLTGRNTFQIYIRA
jgi:hypothetical protein